jgi:tetratricopeptide (TPR) repeat protein
MKITSVISLILLILSISSCSKSVEYSEEFKKETAGKYLFNPDDIIEVYYQDNELLLNWRGSDKIKPVVLAKNEFFVADMYKKLHFVQHPETAKRYLSVYNEDDPNQITYDYPKVSDDFKTPSQHLKNKNYEKALEGFLEVKKKDSTSAFIDEYEFNKLGYKYIQENKYQDAVEVFKLNIALHPTSDNCYDSLGDVYLITGDSLQAYTNYKKALDLNNKNKGALQFVKAYEAVKGLN